MSELSNWEIWQRACSRTLPLSCGMLKEKPLRARDWGAFWHGAIPTCNHQAAISVPPPGGRSSVHQSNSMTVIEK
jgi:hypothetical protein